MSTDQTIRAVIVDDELSVIEGLKAMLASYCPKVSMVGHAQTISQAKQLLISKPIDLLFLDIKLGRSNGFQLLKDFTPLEFQVIFITAHNQYAVEAFRFSALDYLLKPIDPDELIESIRRTRQAIYHETLHLQLQNLLHHQNNPRQDKTIVLKTSEAVYIVKIREIVYCQAQGNYTVFHLVAGKPIIVSHTLKRYHQLLEDHGFYRCHQSFLINLDFLKMLDKRDGGSLRLVNDETIPVSAKKKEQLFKLLRSVN